MRESARWPMWSPGRGCMLGPSRVGTAQPAAGWGIGAPGRLDLSSSILQVNQGGARKVAKQQEMELARAQNEEARCRIHVSCPWP